MEENDPFPQGLLSVLEKSPELRKESEILEVAKWLRERVTAFQKISTECKVGTCQPYELIIREGDLADCMYVLLVGKASVHQKGTMEADKEDQMSNDEDQNASPKTFEETTEDILELETGQTSTSLQTSHELGPQVSVLKSGAIFGEVALIEACVRTASIVALPDKPTLRNTGFHRHAPHSITQTAYIRNGDNPPSTDKNGTLKELEGDGVRMMIISRDLYDQTVRTVLEEQFQFRMNFINRLPYFTRIKPRTKKQIALALELESYPFGSTIVRQGSVFKGLYYLIRGEVCVSLRLEKQRPKVCPTLSDLPVKRNMRDVFLLCACNPYGPKGIGTSCIGDLELLLDSSPYIWSIRATRDTSVFFLSRHNAKRFVYGHNSHRSPSVPLTFLRTQFDLCQTVRSCLEMHLTAMTPDTQIYLTPYIQQLNRCQSELRSVVQPQLIAEQRLALSSEQQKQIGKRLPQHSLSNVRYSTVNSGHQGKFNLQDNNNNKEVGKASFFPEYSGLTRAKTITLLSRRNAWGPAEATSDHIRLAKVETLFNQGRGTTQLQISRATLQSRNRIGTVAAKLVLERNYSEQLEMEVAMFLDRITLTRECRENSLYQKETTNQPDTNKNISGSAPKHSDFEFRLYRPLPPPTGMCTWLPDL
ncbi:hypothetical protein D915_005785 [Fasciola hepatica]|uniref:Cyclic nucleotide-binding domain-containing protein n=1 Tax=Fasciola hepatica TaxID=6192 RepID=A0A4E0R4F4_FASHE|nr:hypothetical protein D915_005785 [Fasciola hepatica]